jgi:hypothetical protein
VPPAAAQPGDVDPVGGAPNYPASTVDGTADQPDIREASSRRDATPSFA